MPLRSSSVGAPMIWRIGQLLALMLLADAAQVVLAEPSSAPQGQRDRLTSARLTAGEDQPIQTVQNAYFLPVGETAAALHRFSGTLSIPETEMQMRYVGQHPLDEPSHRWFPKVDLEFVSHQGHLIPVERDILRGGGPRSAWNLIVSPGRVWSEAGDGGLSRASFPFVLAGTRFNDSHNGLATFLFDDSRVSPIQFQIVQEAAPGNRFDSWGRLAAHYDPHPLQRGPALVSGFEEERARRLPVRPWRDLVDRYGPERFTAFANRADRTHITTSGLIIDGTIYFRPCATRFGAYPYCRDMRHGIYSVTKSLGALVSLLRLAQKYGDFVFGLKIADTLEITADHEGWREVRFADALNMVTGTGDGPQDPNSKSHISDDRGMLDRFASARSTEEKLRVAFSSVNYPWDPGEVLRYRSVDTFILAAAMDAFLKSREGPSANLWDMTVEEVLRPIGMPYAPMMHSVEADGRRGTPLFGWGLFLTVDEVAKLVLLLQNGGQHQGRQLLSATKLEEALYHTEAHGKTMRTPAFSYYMSFWHMAMNLRGCRVNVPNMKGYGGNVVQLLPNGLASFLFQDGNNFVEREMAQAANAIRPFCPL